MVVRVVIMMMITMATNTVTTRERAKSGSRAPCPLPLPKKQVIHSARQVLWFHQVPSHLCDSNSNEEWSFHIYISSLEHLCAISAHDTVAIQLARTILFVLFEYTYWFIIILVCQIKLQKHLHHKMLVYTTFIPPSSCSCTSGLSCDGSDWYQGMNANSRNW